MSGGGLKRTPESNCPKRLLAICDTPGTITGFCELLLTETRLQAKLVLAVPATTIRLREG